MADTATQGDRFAPITPDNHSGAIWITTILCLVYSSITITTRGWLRLKMYGIDDGLILIAFIMHIGEAIATMLALSRGLAQTLRLLSPSAVSYVSESTFASTIFFILAATAAKASTLFLMMRLFNLQGRKSHTNHHKQQRLYLVVCFVILGTMVAWGITSLVAVSVNCETSTLIESPEDSQCTSQYLRWQIITGFDVATEAFLVLNAVLIVVPATTSSNPGVAQSTILVLQQVYICWSIIAATLPNLKAFVRSFGSGFGIGIDMDTYTNAYGSKNSGRQRSYEMGQVSGNRSLRQDGSGHMGSRTGNDAGDEDHVMPIRSINAGQGGLVHGHALPRSAHGQQHPRREGRGEVDSIESTGSDAQIIRKDVGWDIRYEDDTTPRAI